MTSRIRTFALSLTRPQKIAIMVLADVIALPICLMLGYLLRLGEADYLEQYGFAAATVMALATIPVLYLSGLYRNVVRFFDVRMLRTAGISLAVLAIGTYGITLALGAHPPPRASLLIYWFIAFSYVLFSRLFVRHLLHQSPAARLKRPRVAVYGAGEAGFQLVNSMRDGRTHTPICFFDDDSRFVGRHLSGLRVYGMDDVIRVVYGADIDEVVLALPNASPERRKFIVNRFASMGILVKTLPTLDQLADSSALEFTIREVQIEDLLGRKSVPPMEGLFSRCVQGKCVLVTGAGGSIGSELCRQILSRRPALLLLVEHSEFALYTIESELKTRYPQCHIIGVLGSVLDEPLLERVTRIHCVDTIYHAAAYKHVPLVEDNMAVGLRNNVEGAWVVAKVAAQNQVRTCVLISTDKAVRPPNVMGASKRCAELIFQAFAAERDVQTTFSMVRFGNVLGSSGSVVPLFREQIQRGGPLTVTHADITRYFMLIPEAAQLVIQAGAMASGGEVFVLDMGDPVKVMDLARSMIEMSGLSERSDTNPDGDIEIRVTGLRPGEKLYEELLIGSHVSRSEHPRIMSSRENALSLARLEGLLGTLLGQCRQNSDIGMMSALQRIVPEYAPYSQWHRAANDAACAPQPARTRLFQQQDDAPAVMPARRAALIQ